jgi:two-component system chemotaxis response regulator CheB
VEPDRVLIAPGGRHLTLAGRANRARASLSEPDAPAVSGHRPSVDVLFRSVARIYGPTAVGVIMTGMGRDGADGCLVIRAGGGVTLGQDEATSVVYGMNKAAFLEGAVQLQFALDDLPELIRALATPRRG